MHILIYLHRIISQNKLSELLTLNYENKSIDELAQTDTLIMDDFFFLERPFNMDGFKYLLTHLGLSSAKCALSQKT